MACVVATVPSEVKHVRALTKPLYVACSIVGGKAQNEQDYSRLCSHRQVRRHIINIIIIYLQKIAIYLQKRAGLIAFLAALLVALGYMRFRQWVSLVSDASSKQVYSHRLPHCLHYMYTCRIYSAVLTRIACRYIIIIIIIIRYIIIIIIIIKSRTSFSSCTTTNSKMQLPVMPVALLFVSLSLFVCKTFFA